MTMRDVYVAGVAMSPFGKYPERSTREMAEKAVADALADAGLEPQVVQYVYFGNAIGGIMTGQEMVRAQSALRGSGLLGRPIVNVENACASASTAFHLAWLSVASGQADVAIAIGAEKMTSADKSLAKRALASAVDLAELEELEAQVGEGAGGDRSFFMDLYAQTARQYMAESGATVEDFADVAVKNRWHGSMNPHAQFQSAVTRDEVLGSREVVDPLTLFMCSSIGDGAAAVVLSSQERLVSGRAPIRVSATVLNSGFGQPTTLHADNAGVRASRAAYEMAGIGPSDLDLVELHDAAATAELVVYEELGLCEAGGGPELLRSGATCLGGRLPVNTSGGLLAKGHPVGATGCAQLVEISDQLWGRAGQRQVEGARVGLAENGGGYIGSDSAAVSITILERR
jgi:acetyl-CoA acetyltransferase